MVFTGDHVEVVEAFFAGMIYLEHNGKRSDRKNDKWQGRKKVVVDSTCENSEHVVFKELFGAMFRKAIPGTFGTPLNGMHVTVMCCLSRNVDYCTTMGHYYKLLYELQYVN